MMSDHGANQIFFNKKNKDWTSRTLANHPPPLPPPTSNNISYLPYSPPIPPQSGRHMCITPYEKNTVMAQLKTKQLKQNIFKSMRIYGFFIN